MIDQHIEQQQEKHHTDKQRKAVHLLFKQLAEQLNEAGLDMKKVLKPEVDIPWNEVTVKEYLWRPIQRTQLDKESFTQLNSKEIDQVFLTLARHLGQKTGLVINFPSIETMLQDWRRLNP